MGEIGEEGMGLARVIGPIMSYSFDAYVERHTTSLLINSIMPGGKKI